MTADASRSGWQVTPGAVAAAVAARTASGMEGACGCGKGEKGEGCLGREEGERARVGRTVQRAEVGGRSRGVHPAPGPSSVAGQEASARCSLSRPSPCGPSRPADSLFFHAQPLHRDLGIQIRPSPAFRQGWKPAQVGAQVGAPENFGQPPTSRIRLRSPCPTPPRPSPPPPPARA